MLFLYVSVLLFMKQQWQAGCFVFSWAVSLKMNILLFAPGLLLLLLQDSPTLLAVIVQRLFFGCAVPQLILGAPFLFHHPVAYLRKAFELDRVFFYQWTVNFKFLPPHWFISKPWALFLLALHLSGLMLLARQWLARTAVETTTTLAPPITTKAESTFSIPNKNDNNPPRRLFLVGTHVKLAPEYIVYTLMASNFVGIAFARTLHYQFYVSTAIPPPGWLPMSFHNKP